MTTAEMVSGKLQIGEVIKTTFAVLGRNFVPFFLLAFVLAGIPAIVLGLMQPPGDEPESVGLAVVSVVGTLITVVAGLVLQGALTYGVVNVLNGRPIGLTECLATGLRNFLPLLGLGLLTAFGVALGFLLLVVPGIMLAVAWSVVVPVLIAERRRVLDTFGRSAALTRGNRWRIFGLFLLSLLAMVVILAVVGIVGGLAGVIESDMADNSPGSIVLSTVVSTLSSLLGATFGAVLYVDLRRLKEGVGPEGIAAIFD
jgi:hypothetical protein